MRKFIADEAEKGLRADIFVAKRYPEFSRSVVAKLFDGGFVNEDGEELKPSYKIHPGDIVEVDEAILKQKPPKIDLPVIYEDENVVVINKPAGVLTHSKGGLNNEATVATWLIDHLKRHNYSIKQLFPGGHPGNSRLGIVHRLDRATSGVMICAKNQGALVFLQKQFSQRKTKKTYLAVVDGAVDPPEAVIDAPIDRNPKKPQTFRVSSSGKTAQTYYRVLRELKTNGVAQSVLELKPVTGRTHQLRVHLSHMGFPIVGDPFYGEAGKHMLLQASSLEITLPGGERKVFVAQTPEYFKNYV